jgi:hypothetical protein
VPFFPRCFFGVKSQIHTINFDVRQSVAIQEEGNESNSNNVNCTTPSTAL